MSINDINNVSNLYRASTYLNVNKSNTDKPMAQEQSLFDMLSNYSQPEQNLFDFSSSYSQQDETSFLLFPGANQYDDESAVKQKSEGFLFM